MRRGQTLPWEGVPDLPGDPAIETAKDEVHKTVDRLQPGQNLAVVWAKPGEDHVLTISVSMASSEGERK